MTAPPFRRSLATAASQVPERDQPPGPWLPPSAGSRAEQDRFKEAMRHLAGGVSIVTLAKGDKRGGLTATSLTSLSAEPPSLIVCINQSSSSLRLLRDTGRFAVSVLGHGHQAIADRFAGRDGSPRSERFALGEWIGPPGCPPVLADALASFECVVDEALDRYSHTVVIARVTESRAVGGDGALVYWRATYDTVGALAPKPDGR